jgi:uncharacterized membrane protein YqaE (UPF0057 family)
MAKFFIPFLVLFLSQPVFAAYYNASSFMKEPSAEKTIEEFRNLSVKERNERIKEVKKEIKKHKQNQGADETTLLYVILAILLPPLAVYLHQGEINTKFWISLILSLIFWIPGVVYALLVVLDQI